MFGWFKGWLRKRRLKKLRLIRRKQRADRAFDLECKRLHDAAHKAKRAAGRAQKKRAAALREQADGPPRPTSIAMDSGDIDALGLTAAKAHPADKTVDLEFLMFGRHGQTSEPAAPTETFSGKGGAFGGAGASGSWDDDLGLTGHAAIESEHGATAAWIAAAPHAPDYLRDMAAQHLQSHVDRHDHHAAHTSYSDHSHDHSSSGTSDWSSVDSSSYCDGGSDSSGGGDT